jgi:hypothetical protein
MVKIRSTLARWRSIARFCSTRAIDYSELLALEFELAKSRLAREIIAVVLLAVAGLFTLSFLCVALVATAWNTRYFLPVVWGIAAVWFVVCVVSFVIARSQKPTEPLHVLQEQIRLDLDVLKETLK